MRKGLIAAADVARSYRALARRRSAGLGGGRAEALGAAGAGLLPLDLAVLRRRGGDQDREQVLGGVRDLGDGALEHLGVGLRGLRHSADLADVLQRGVVHLLRGGLGLEVMERANVPAHAARLPRRRPADKTVDGATAGAADGRALSAVRRSAHGGQRWAAASRARVRIR